MNEKFNYKIAILKDYKIATFWWLIPKDWY